MLLPEQTVENKAIARSEDTPEMHSSFFRKLRFDRNADAERIFSFEHISERHCVVGAGAEALSCCTCEGKPGIKDP